MGARTENGEPRGNPFAIVLTVQFCAIKGILKNSSDWK